MIERKELEKSGPPGFHIGQKEKDYMQHWCLSYLSRSGFSGVFKGGTCLQKAFGLARYSEDLDFSLDGAAEPDYDSLSAFLVSAGFAVVGVKREEGKGSASAKLRYRGPLYSGTRVSEGTLVFEFSKRERLLVKPKLTLIAPPYPDLLPYQLLVMDKDEIAAEKVRAIMTRVSARDLFDLYFLARMGAAVRPEHASEKLSHYGIRFERKALRGRIALLKRVWKSEISAFSPSPLRYDEAARVVLEKIGSQ